MNEAIPVTPDAPQVPFFGTTFWTIVAILLLTGLALVVWRRWYAQLVLLITSVVSILASVVGIVLLVDRTTRNDLVALAITGLGLLFLLSVAISIKLLYFKRHDRDLPVTT